MDGHVKSTQTRKGEKDKSTILGCGKFAAKKDWKTTLLVLSDYAKEVE